MPVNPQTPGVYIDEIPVLPASVAGVATAVPAFIGHVEKAVSGAEIIRFNTPIRITSLKEYETYFGVGDPQDFSIEINDITSVTPNTRDIIVAPASASPYRLYYSMVLYFNNGGGPCYIIPVGSYGDAIAAASLQAGIDAVAKLDEPTLLVMPDAVALSASDMGTVYNHALSQCALLKDRFTIMDVKSTSNVSTDASNFRDYSVGINNLKYGAVYYPYLSSRINYTLNENLVHVTTLKTNSATASDSSDSIAYIHSVEAAIALCEKGYANALHQVAGLTTTLVNDYNTFIKSAIDTVSSALASAPADFATAVATLTTDVADLVAYVKPTSTTGPFFNANNAYINGTATAAEGVDLINVYKQIISDLKAIRVNAYTTLSTDSDLSAFKNKIGSLNYLKVINPPLYNSILSKINNYTTIVPPSGAMAGIYAQVDNARGVWKAPANVSINYVSGPTVNITNAEQDGLNIDATSGKSINCIRAFTGRGTLVWGARTLAGNDNEWRYINVRRLFNFIEESVQKATGFVVFEPNTSATWVRVKTMIEAFLTNLWREGALAGASTREAFFVNVGLGTTMTADDILNGRMIVDIGIAATRPAEFIIIRFEHKLQES